MAEADYILHKNIVTEGLDKRTLRILASKGGIMTLMDLRRSMEIKRENLERILHELVTEGRIVRTNGKQGIESISLVKK